MKKKKSCKNLQIFLNFEFTEATKKHQYTKDNLSTSICAINT